MNKEIRRVDILSDIDKEIIHDCSIVYLTPKELIARYEQYLTEEEIKKLKDGK